MDLTSFPRPNVAVDVALATIDNDALKVLMIERETEPFKSKFVLPGGFVHEGESPEETARRVLLEKTGLSRLFVEQLRAFGEPGRDPRGWVVSVAHFALVPAARLAKALRDDRARLITVMPRGDRRSSHRGTGAGSCDLLLDGEAVSPGFDHGTIVTAAIERLRADLDRSMIAFAMLPKSFTLLELQRVHELVLGRSLNKPHFRKKMLGMVFANGSTLTATGELDRSGSHRPAEKYRLS